MQKQAIMRAPCRLCLCLTKHEILFTKAVYGDVDDNVPAETVTYQMLQCRGCDSISMSENFQASGFEDLAFYPAPVARAEPKWMKELSFDAFLGSASDPPFYDLFREVYEALKGGQRRLATMGVRALLELMMIAKIGDQGSFASNLTKFVGEGFISPLQRDALAKALDLGHAVIHRHHKPSTDDINTVLDVTEGIYASIYLHRDAIEKVAKRTPPRKR